MFVKVEIIFYYIIFFFSVDPYFYSMNLLMIGKTHLRMKNYLAAKSFLLKARDYPVVTPDDKKVWIKDWGMFKPPKYFRFCGRVGQNPRRVNL